MHAHKYTTPELIHGMGQIEKKEVDFLFHYIEHFIKWWSCTSINKEGKIMIISLNEGHAHHHAMVFSFHCFIDQIMLIYSKCIFFFFLSKSLDSFELAAMPHVHAIPFNTRFIQTKLRIWRNKNKNMNQEFPCE